MCNFATYTKYINNVITLLRLYDNAYKIVVCNKTHEERNQRGLHLLSNDRVGNIHQFILDEITEDVNSLPQEQRETVDRKLTEVINDIESFNTLLEKLKNDK